MLKNITTKQNRGNVCVKVTLMSSSFKLKIMQHVNVIVSKPSFSRRKFISSELLKTLEKIMPKNVPINRY